MLRVKHKLAQSGIHGLGLFADEDIAKGTVIWEFTPGLDFTISFEQVKLLDVRDQAFINTYAYVDKTLPGFYTVAVDAARFVNHSDTPNMGNGDANIACSVAFRDIKAGEELTENYHVDYGAEPLTGWHSGMKIG